MMIATGVVCIVFGLIVVIGQLISVIDFGLAQRLGLQEKDDDTDSLHRSLELNTARWDLAIFWTLPVAGGLMLAHHPWWPLMALVSGAVCVDTAGRETAKVLGLGAHGVRTGSVSETRLYFFFLGIMFLIGVWCIGFGAAALV